MSSPIPIRRARASSSSSSASSMASSHSTAPTSLASSQLYVPVHKRAGSTSSRASSPASARTPSSPIEPKQHPRIYTTGFLLSLRPQADESMKEKMRNSCPEVVMNRRTRKNLEFAEHQRRREARLQQQQQKQHHHSQPQAVTPVPPSPAMAPAPAPTAAPATPKAPAPVAAVQAAAPSIKSRVLPRRNRPAGRGPERRRQALQTMNDNWRDARLGVPAPLPVV